MRGVLSEARKKHEAFPRDAAVFGLTSLALGAMLAAVWNLPGSHGCCRYPRLQVISELSLATWVEITARLLLFDTFPPATFVRQDGSLTGFVTLHSVSLMKCCA